MGRTHGLRSSHLRKAFDLRNIISRLGFDILGRTLAYLADPDIETVKNNFTLRRTNLTNSGASQSSISECQRGGGLQSETVNLLFANR
jgi:hypothetical protein